MHILTFTRTSGVLTPTPITLTTHNNPHWPGPVPSQPADEPKACPYCQSPLAKWRGQKFRCYAAHCPSNGATPEELHQKLTGWLPPYYTATSQTETWLAAAILYKGIVVPLKQFRQTGYNIAIIATSTTFFANAGFLTGLNAPYIPDPAYTPINETIKQIRTRKNYYWK